MPMRFVKGWMIASPVNSKTCGGFPSNAPERNAVPAGNFNCSLPSARAASSTTEPTAGRGKYPSNAISFLMLGLKKPVLK